MILGITEDFTSTVLLDSQLKAVPSSGLYVNNGVHPSITTENLLAFLPKTEFTFLSWKETSTYNSFIDSKNRSDIIMYGGLVYQSIANDNTGNIPSADSEYWVETNIESLRLKVFLESVKNKVYSDLSLTKRLVNNQYIYEVGDTLKSLPSNYASWVLEPKGSDYVTIKVNEIAIQKDGTDPVDVYVINQGKLIDTISVAPDNGRLTFRDVDLSFQGKGQLILAIDATDVYVGNSTIDPLRFDGFVAYTGIGDGDSPEGATYTYNTFGNGIGINVSAYLDASQYIDNNLSELGNYVRAAFEYMAFQMFLHNSNNKSNRSQRIQMSDEMLIAELKNTQADTIVSRYHKERKKAIATMQKTFDTELNDHDGIEVTIGSV